MFPIAEPNRLTFSVNTHGQLFKGSFGGGVLTPPLDFYKVISHLNYNFYLYMYNIHCIKMIKFTWKWQHCKNKHMYILLHKICPLVKTLWYKHCSMHWLNRSSYYHRQVGQPGKNGDVPKEACFNFGHQYSNAFISSSIRNLNYNRLEYRRIFWNLFYLNKNSFIYFFLLFLTLKIDLEMTCSLLQEKLAWFKNNSRK